MPNLSLCQTLDPPQILDPCQPTPILGQHEKLTNPHGSPNPRNYLTHTTHEPTHPRDAHNQQTNNKPMQPVQFSKQACKIKLRIILNMRQNSFLLQANIGTKSMSIEQTVN